MSLMQILFSPKGRIGPGAFWRGIIILLSFQIVVTIIGMYGPASVAGILEILSILTIYPYLCVFGKRLHDSGKSAWMFLLFVLGYVIILIASMVMAPGFGDFMTQYMELTEAGDTEGLEALSEQSGRMFAIPSLVGTIIANGVLGFLAARLHSYPETNQYGPPPGGALETDDDDFL